jgi:toxin FitB
MYLIDTNIVSLLDPRRQASVAPFIEWLRCNGDYIYLSAITLTELENGILKLKRDGKIAKAAGYEFLRDAIIRDFNDRILSLDANVALRISHLIGHVWSMTIELTDIIIAATADIHNLTILSRNLRHFVPTGVSVIDPIVQLPPDVESNVNY